MIQTVRGACRIGPRLKARPYHCKHSYSPTGSRAQLSPGSKSPALPTTRVAPLNNPYNKESAQFLRESGTLGQARPARDYQASPRRPCPAHAPLARPGLRCPPAPATTYHQAPWGTQEEPKDSARGHQTVPPREPGPPQAYPRPCGRLAPRHPACRAPRQLHVRAPHSTVLPPRVLPGAHGRPRAPRGTPSDAPRGAPSRAPTRARPHRQARTDREH